MASEQELMQGARRAAEAGQDDLAREFVARVKKLRTAPPAENTPANRRSGLVTGLGEAGNAATFGMARRAGAGIAAGISQVVPGYEPMSYNTAFDRAKAADEAAAAEHPYAATAGQIGGSALGGGALIARAPNLALREGQAALNAGKILATGGLTSELSALGETGDVNAAVKAGEVGPAAGLAGAAIGKAAPAVAQFVKNRVSPSAAAISALARASRAPGETAADAAARVTRDFYAYRQVHGTNPTAAEIVGTRQAQAVGDIVGKSRGATEVAQQAEERALRAAPQQLSTALQRGRLTASEAGVEATRNRKMTAAMAPIRANPVPLSDETLNNLSEPEVLEALPRNLRKRILDVKSAQQDTSQFYHGTSKPIGGLYDYGGSDANIYGQGLYTTNSRSIAKGYTRKGGGKEPAVYSVSRDTKFRPFDMEAPLNDEVKPVLSRLAQHHEVVAAALDENPKNLREVYDLIRGLSRDHNMSRSDVNEVFDAVATNLQEKGYSGLQHIGGLRTGKPPHTVQIHFEPQSNKVNLTPAEDAPQLTLQEMDSIRQAFRSKAGSGDKFRFNTYAKEVEDAASAVEPRYGAALKAYGTRSAIAENVPTGRGVMSPSASTRGVQDTFRNAKPAAQLGTRLGARTAAIEQAGESPAGAARTARRLAEDTGLQQRLGTVLPAQEAAQMRQAGEVTTRALQGVAAATPRKAVGADAELNDAVNEVLKGVVLTSGRASGGFIANFFSGLGKYVRYAPGARKKLAELASDPSKTPAVVQYLQKQGMSRNDILSVYAAASGAQASRTTK